MTDCFRYTSDHFLLPISQCVISQTGGSTLVNSSKVPICKYPWKTGERPSWTSNPLLIVTMGGCTAEEETLSGITRDVSFKGVKHQGRTRLWSGGHKGEFFFFLIFFHVPEFCISSFSMHLCSPTSPSLEKNHCWTDSQWGNQKQHQRLS